MEDLKTCEHKYIHLRTADKIEHGNFNDCYIRTDIFFCEKCLEQKEIVKREWNRGYPQWW